MKGPRIYFLGPFFFGVQEPVSLARQRFTVMGTLLGRLGLQLVKGEGSPVLTGVQGAVLACSAGQGRFNLYYMTSLTGAKYAVNHQRRRVVQ